jgi:lipopolysaccharide export system permease protein
MVRHTRPFMSFSRIPSSRFLVPLLLAAMGAGLCAILVPAEILAVQQQLIGFPDSDVAAHQLRPLILGALCLLPAIAALVYGFCGTLDRYIARQFAAIFGVCLSSLLLIWLLIDLSDKISEFRDSQNVLLTIGKFYAARSPAILLLLLPYSLLLSLLYSLGKLSGNREIIAMIQAGRGILRITFPLMLAGVFFSLLSLGLNYHWAPIAEGNVDSILDEARGKNVTEASNVLYHNPRNRRLWMIGAFPTNYQMGQPLLNVEITTTREDDTLESRISAKRALWDRRTREWTLEDPVIGTFKEGRPPEFESPDGSVKFNSWPETPWQLIKPGLSAAYLGIPDLSSWLASNRRNEQFADPAPYLTQWHYRWALPFTCLVTVLLATPLAIHFSRRGPGGGIFLAVVLSALMLLVSNISLAIGEAGTLRPAQAAWIPNLAFGLLGLYLFHRRISGRPIYAYLRRCLPGND